MNDVARLAIVAPNDEVAVPAPEPPPDFGDFWLLWPRGCRVAKKDAIRAWSKLTHAQQVAALVGLVKWRYVWEYRARQRHDFYEYLPYPATWINGERWEDDVPPEFERRDISRERAPDPEPELTGPRPAIPQHVRDMIARLKKGNGG